MAFKFRETIAASAARTATLTGADNVTMGATALHVIINVTALASTPSVVPKIQGKSATGTYYDILVGTAITDVTVGTPPATIVLKVGPGGAPIANASAADFVPGIWRVVMTHADSDSMTYSIAAETW